MKKIHWRYRVKFYSAGGYYWGTLIYNSYKEAMKHIKEYKKEFGYKAKYAGKFK